MDIQKKVIIITGASKGIGMATAQALAKRGATLVLAARSTGELEKLAASLPDAYAVTTDMQKPQDIKNLVAETIKKYGRIDALINNAGQGIYGPVESVDISQYQSVMTLNVYGPLVAMQEVIPHMRAQGGGTIINVSSMVSKNYFPFLGAYASTKYALNALSLTARQELAKDNIIVSVVHPKMTATDFGKNALGVKLDWHDRPMPEIDTPQQVAEKIIETIQSGAAETML